MVHHDKDTDVDDNLTIPDIMDKIDLEILRLCIRLPVNAGRDKTQQVNTNQVVIVNGQTGIKKYLHLDLGSGKSLQISQYVAGLDIGKVVCTQPTKIAAISLANHLTQECVQRNLSIDCIANHNSLHHKSCNHSIITFVTDSILLDILVEDPTLSSYGCVIVDQAHQRSLCTDILLAFLRQLLTRRHDLKLIIISADVQTKLFSDHFYDCPVISVSDRLFPVDIKWCDEHVNNYLDKALDIIVDIHNTGDNGDILVFLVTLDETEKACVDIKKRLSKNPDGIIALSLHDDLQATDLQNIFKIDSNRRRKILFTTNCVGTSITIPGIRYVIDTGLIKERFYDERSQFYSLRIHQISQSSAIRRCNHAGYTQTGICYRLYSQQIYDNMSKSSEPEIKYVNLSNVILKMIKLGITDIMDFNFIESPSLQNVNYSLDTLYMLSAITTRKSPLSLTSKGKLFYGLPLDPRLSALIVDAKIYDVLSEGVIIASALSMSCNLNCQYGSKDDERNLDLTKTQFHYGHGDVISIAEAYIKWRSLYGKIEFKRWSCANKINLKLMQRLHYKVRQLQPLLYYLDLINPPKKLKIPSHMKSQTRDRLRKLLFQSYTDRLAVFTGLDKIGYITMNSDYQYLMHTSSPLIPLAINPKVIVYQDILVVTEWDSFLINITPVDEEWLQSSKDCNDNAKVKNMLNNLMITHTIDNIGSIIFSEYDTDTINKMIKNFLQDEYIRCHIIRNVKSGNLQIITIKSKMTKLLDVINTSITLKKEKLSKAIKILCKYDDNNAPHLIIGRGIIVKDIILSSDCIAFKITLRYTGNGSPDENAVMDVMNQVRTFITSCGELAVDIDSTDINESKDCKNIGFDKIIYQEIRNQSLLKAMDMQIISGYEINIENGSLANCSISRDRIVVQFCWSRNPRNGTATITCRDHAAAINVQNDFPLTIDNQVIDAEIDRNCPSKLFVRGVPNVLTDTDIKNAISVTNRRAITRIYFHRVTTYNDDNISSIELESAIRSVLDRNGYYGKYSDVMIKSTSSFDDNSNVVADVVFPIYGEAVMASPILDKGIYRELINEPISVRLSHSRIIRCQQQIYGCVDKDIHRVRETVQSIDGDEENLVHIDIEGSGKHPETWITIAIRSLNEFNLNEIVYRIGKIIVPIKVPINVPEILQYLNTDDGKNILISLTGPFVVYTKVDWNSQSILIYGAQEVKEQAADYCQKQIDVLLSRYNIIDLVESNKSKDLVKMIIKRYGINLNKLRQSSGANVIGLNRQNNTLIVIGDEKSYANVLNEIDLCCNALDIVAEEANDEIMVNECVACFCEVDDKNYRLQCCGHLYCQGCILEQANSAIKSFRFPLNCANCNEGFVIQDLEWLLMKSPQPQLFDVLMTEFIRRHPNVWHYCPTPECKLVYKRSESYEVFTCPNCQKKTCRGCDNDDHPGYSCAQIKENQSIEKFLKENARKVKKCPKCNAPIEKNLGCNRMECRFCHNHFCWLCLAWYKTADECYRHLRKQHAGID